MSAIELVEARAPEDHAAARALFVEYADQLGVDLCFQNFTFELEHLAQVYGPPGGCLLLARAGGDVAGCVAVRPIADGVCEMKRLYVRAAARAAGLGRRLARASIAAARARGHARMVLDTLASMTPARRLYASLGFRETTPYYANPLPDVVYMELDLAGGELT